MGWNRELSCFVEAKVPAHAAFYALMIAYHAVAIKRKVEHSVLQFNCA